MTTSVDYLVIGSGASAMAFADTIISETEATVAKMALLGQLVGSGPRAAENLAKILASS